MEWRVKALIYCWAILMFIAGPLSPKGFPRVFWPLVLGLTALVAMVLLYEPLVAMHTRGSTNYNEGWNAYHQAEAMQGQPLYGAPPALVGADYPPLSFHLIGLASRLTGNVNQTGRWVALLSLALVALLCGAIVRRFTGSTPLAAFAALSAVIWVAVYEPDRIGMNDPQLLGSVFSLLGLYAYLRERENRLWLCISALAFTLSVFTKHNLLAFPAAVGLHAALNRKWRSLPIWGGVIAGVSALLLALTRWLDGPYFLAHLLAPRSRTTGYVEITGYFTLFQLPIALAVVWSLRHLRRSLNHVLVLALIVAHVLALAFAGGDGVDRNIFFDCIWSLTMVSALIFAEYAPRLSGVRRRGALLAALLVAPVFGAALILPQTLRDDYYLLKSLPDRERDFDRQVSLLRNRPGPALCEDILLCFDAGKPFTYDAYFTNRLVRVGRLKEDRLVAMAADAGFSTVQVQRNPADGDNLTPGKRLRFTARFMEALLKRYRLEERLSHSFVLVPDERTDR
jgi:hypothetical protein